MFCRRSSTPTPMGRNSLGRRSASAGQRRLIPIASFPEQGVGSYGVTADRPGILRLRYARDERASWGKAATALRGVNANLRENYDDIATIKDRKTREIRSFRREGPHHTFPNINHRIRRTLSNLCSSPYCRIRYNLSSASGWHSSSHLRSQQQLTF